MTGTQWLLLVLVIAAVVGAYLYIRRQASEDPWQDMEEGGEASDDEMDRGMSLGGDSYIIGVRTIGGPMQESSTSPAPRERQPQQAPPPLTPQNDPPTRPPETASSAPEKSKKTPPWMAFNPKSKAPQKTNDEVENLRPQRAPAGQEKLFIVHVSSRDQGCLDGPDVHAALQEQKLKFGMHEIYHRITEANGVPDSVYAIANMLKPGFLDPVEQDHLSTPGLTIFLQLPGPIDAVKATRDMLETASALAERLGGEVLDDKRSLLKAQQAQFMLDEAAELDRKQRLQAL